MSLTACVLQLRLMCEERRAYRSRFNNIFIVLPTRHILFIKSSRAEALKAYWANTAGRIWFLKPQFEQVLKAGPKMFGHECIQDGIESAVCIH